jgi:hypothetical protein
MLAQMLPNTLRHQQNDSASMLSSGGKGGSGSSIRDEAEGMLKKVMEEVSRRKG